MKKSSPASTFLVAKKLAEHARLALQAAQNTADSDVRLHVDRMRQLRALLKRQSTQSTDADMPSAIGLRTYEELQHAQKDIERAESFISIWSQRYLQLFSRADLLQTADGSHALLDAELPATWDWDNDLLVCVIEHQNHPILQALEERQQKRVMVVIESATEWTRPLPAQWRKFQTGDMLAYDAWSSPPIGHVSVIDTLLTPASTALIQLVRMGLMSHLTNAATFRAFGQRWVAQGLENLPVIAQHPVWSSLKDLASGLPAVIVSPGPSLQRNLHSLKDVQDRVLIIATAQAIMALQVAGIVPHVIVVADPQDMSHYFDGYTFNQKTVLAVGRTCAPNLFKLAAQHYVTQSISPLTDGWISKILQDEHFLHAGGSVAITAFSLALNWSCKSIALVGQDLSLKDGQQYAANTADAGLAWHLPQQGEIASPSHIPDGIRGMHQQSGGRPEDIDKSVQLMQLPGYYGGKVWTKADYYLYHGHFERIASEIHQSSTSKPRLYNCTEGGAHIAGYEQCSLQSWIEAHVANQAHIEWHAGVSEIERRHQKTGLAIKKLQQWQRQTLQAMSECLQASKASLKLLSNAVTAQGFQQLKMHENILLGSLDKLEFISIAHQQAIFDALESVRLAHDLQSALQAEGELITLIQNAVSSFSPLVEKIKV